ncbi:hypothetical protein THAOC_18290, partial [Thalassiosira oceanica]
MSAHTAPPSKKKRKSIEEDSIPTPEFTKLDHINLTSHSGTFGVDPIPVSWGHPDPLVRGPVICTVRHSSQRNAIGAHSGSYCVYTGLAVAAGKLNPEYVPNLKLTSPVFDIGPHSSWYDPKKDRQHRSLRTPDHGRVLELPQQGVRHPPDHSDHQGAHRPARDARGGPERPAQARRQGAPPERAVDREQGRHRAGLVPPRNR